MLNIVIAYLLTIMYNVFILVETCLHFIKYIVRLINIYLYLCLIFLHLCLIVVTCNFYYRKQSIKYYHQIINMFIHQ